MINSISHEIYTQLWFGMDQTKPKPCAYFMGYTLYVNQGATTWKQVFILFYPPSLMLGCAEIAWTCPSLWLCPVQWSLLPSGDSSHRLLYIDVLKASGHLNTCTNGKLVFRGTCRQLLCHNIDLPINSCMAGDQCICPKWKIRSKIILSINTLMSAPVHWYFMLKFIIEIGWIWVLMLFRY